MASTEQIDQPIKTSDPPKKKSVIDEIQATLESSQYQNINIKVIILMALMKINFSRNKIKNVYTYYLLLQLLIW